MNRFFGLVEYVLAFLFIRGGLVVLFGSIEPVVLPGLFTHLVGVPAIVTYGLLFLLTGLAMVVAKLWKIYSLHKYTLLAMYLTCVYVLILSIAVSGITAGLIMTVVVGVVSAALWIRLKFQKEYIHKTEFEKGHNERY